LRTRRSGDLATHYAQGLHLRLALFNQSGHSLDVDADAATLTRQDLSQARRIADDESDGRDEEAMIGYVTDEVGS
jgi:hypothetical protein